MCRPASQRKASRGHGTARLPATGTPSPCSLTCSTASSSVCARAWHHLTNLLFHTANSVLLFLLLWRLTGAVWRSGFVAALFALHPLHVESVAWVAERKDVLSTFFFLLTIWAYASYVKSSERLQARPKVQSPKPKSVSAPPSQQPPGATFHVSRFTLHPLSHLPPWSFYALSLLLFALGLMSKPMLVTLPCVLLLLDYWPLCSASNEQHAPRSTHRLTSQATILQNSAFSLLREKLPFFLLCAASCVITFRVQQSGGAVLDVSNFPIGSRIANALMSYVRYLGKMAWPEDLAALYLRKAPWPVWGVAVAAVTILAISAAALWQARRRPYLAVGWFWYLGTLVPVIGLVQVGMQTMADRYTYIPLIGIFIILSWGAWDLTRAVGRQQAVAQILNLPYRGFPIRRPPNYLVAPAGYKPAIRQNAILRYPRNSPGCWAFLPRSRWPPACSSPASRSPGGGTVKPSSGG